MVPTLQKNTTILKKLLIESGFDQVGVSKIEPLDQEAKKLEQWLNKGYQGQMSFLENHFEIRRNPGLLLDGAKSIITMLYNYYPKNTSLSKGEFKIARYAYGKDYHKIIKKKLKKAMAIAQEKIGHFNFRNFVDSAPIMEREWAKKAGLGWIGKNTLIINPKKGSYFFIATIVSDLPLVPDQPINDYCGTCKKCIKACPTDAIKDEGYELDASQCISYLTIELKNDIPKPLQSKLSNWIFGCDICQEVCPWNRFSSPHQESKFMPNTHLTAMNKNDWISLEEDLFDSIFEGTAIKRTKYSGLKRNINIVNRLKES